MTTMERLTLKNIIIDTNAFRNLFKRRIRGENLLLLLASSLEIAIPVAVKNEIEDDIRQGEIGKNKEEIEELDVILRRVKILPTENRKSENICLEILKKTNRKFGRIEEADKACIIYTLRLSRKPDHISEHVYLITDDTEMNKVARSIFHRQFIGTVCFTYELLAYLSVRRILKITKSEVKELLDSIRLEYRRGENIRRILKIIGNLEKTMCPYNCPSCNIFKEKF